MPVPIPEGSALHHAFPRVDYSDAYDVSLPADASTDPQVWVDRLFANPSRTFRVVLGARDRLVGAVGLKKASAGGAPFTEMSRSADEVVFGLDDLHLDFRLGVHVADGRLTLGTVVRFHNGFGRLYFLPVRVAHPFIVRRMLRNATRDS
jgi:Protein of unknown function (DUF2867)